MYLSHKVCFSLFFKAIIKTLGIQLNIRKSCRFKQSIKTIRSIKSRIYVFVIFHIASHVVVFLGFFTTNVLCECIVTAF